MTIVNEIKGILATMVADEDCELKSYQYNDKPTANVVLDSKMPNPTALLLQVTDWYMEADMVSGKERTNINISFLTKEAKLDAKGDEQQPIVDDMKDIAIDFIKRLYAVKTLRILDDKIKLKSVFLKGDSNRTGVNLSLDIEERQAHCL